MPANLFDIALKSAESLNDPVARSALFVGIVKSFVAAGRLDDGLLAVDRIPNRTEKRGVLVYLATESIASDNKDSESLFKIVRKLIETDPTAAPVVGRLAHSLLDKDKIDDSVKILALTQKPFEGERSRYEFLAKLLEKNRLDEAKTILAEIADPDFADWGNLALAKWSAKQSRIREATDFVRKISSPEKRAWALFESSRIAPKDKFLELLLESGRSLESIPLEPAGAEMLATELRIVGKAIFEAEEIEFAERILELAEAAATKIPLTIRRFRARLLLAKVLKELGILDSVQNYFNPTEIAKAELSPLDRSRVLQGLAEATAKNDDWSEAIQTAQKNDDEIEDETERANRSVEILRRFAVSGKKFKPTGQPEIDAVQLSAEEFEDYYFSPFAVDGCNC